jgi:hypothetical protein
MNKAKKNRYAGVIAVIGVLGFVLLMWTPKTGTGILAYSVLFAVLVILVIVFSPKKNRYWPNDPQNGSQDQ